MEIAQLCKSAYNNMLWQSLYLCHPYISNMAGAHTLAEQKGHTMMHTYTP